jgi:nitrate reductase NapD
MIGALMTDELHIAGIVVHARPEGAQGVATAIAGWDGTEIHAASPEGKLVVTLEAPTSREIASRMEEIQRMDAVLSASLVYQHSEPLAAMTEEVCP